MPERGWGPAPVRVCDNCYENRGIQLGNFELTVTELSLGNGLKSLSLAPGSQFSLGVNSIVQVGFGLEFLVSKPKSLMTFGRKMTLATSYQIFHSLIELLSHWIFASFSQHLLMVQSWPSEQRCCWFRSLCFVLFSEIKLKTLQSKIGDLGDKDWGEIPSKSLGLLFLGFCDANELEFGRNCARSRHWALYSCAMQMWLSCLQMKKGAHLLPGRWGKLCRTLLEQWWQPWTFP